MDARVFPLLRLPRMLGTFDYHIPKGMDVAVGDLVAIPFRARKVRGVVWDTAVKFPEAERSILRILVRNAMTHAQRGLIEFCAEYYQASAATLLKTTLPAFPLRKHHPLVFSERQGRKRRAAAVRSQLLLYTTHREKDRAMRRAIQQTRGMVLIIFPTFAALERFFDGLGPPLRNQAVLLHGGAEPAHTSRTNYRHIREGEKRIILTTKVGLFAPFPDLAAILLEDETHPAHKQHDQQPFYDTRRLAEELAKRTGAKLVRYTHVPRVESWYALAKQKKHLRWIGRIPAYVQPKLVNIRDERKSGRMGLVSDALLRALVQRRSGPALLFLNSRGVSRDHISVERGREIRPYGIRALEAELREYLPQQHILVLTAETPVPSRKDLSSFHLILATERIFSVLPQDVRYALVAAVDIDLDLHRPDFLARERTFHLLLMLRNMALMSGAPFLIHTRHPHDAIFSELRERNWKLFYTAELRNRKQFGYPPFTALTRILFPTHDRTAQRIIQKLRKRLPEGASLSPVFPGRGRDPFVMVLKESPRGRRLSGVLRHLLPATWKIDVDPVRLE